MSASNGPGKIIRLGRRSPLRISFDGDSISSQTSYGFVNRWMADNPTVSTVNLSVAGACIAPSENATNNLEGRVSQVAAFAPTLHVICIGTNDLAAIDANTFISRMIDHVGELRTAVPGVKIAACGIGPCGPSSTGGHANVNSRRGSANAQLRAAVGAWLDAYIPRGEHPIFDVDAAAQNTTWWNSDQIHPLQIPHRAYWQMLHDALDPYVSQMRGVAANPALSFPNIVDAPLSQSCTMRARVSGLLFGKSATLSISGASTTRGLSAFDATDKALMNGDVPQIQLTSSASNSTLVSGTVTFNGSASSWGVTTQPSSFPTATTTLDATHKASTITLSGGNLTATAGTGGAFQLAMATAQPATDCVYFEVTMGSVGDTATGKLITVHDASLIGHYNSIPGNSAGFTTNGCSISGPGSYSIYNNGVTINSATAANDYLAFPTISAGAVVGVAVKKSTGQVWFQTSSGVWINGDPTVLDGGVQLPAPLSAYYCSVAPKTNTQGETINYGATAFTLPVPLGFRPHG